MSDAEYETVECSMCHGSGVFPYHMPEVKWGPCAACQGTGREPA